MVVVGFSLLVPLLKWACAHQAGSRFQKLLLRDLNFSAIALKTKKMGANFVVTEKGIIFVSVNDIQRGHEDVTRRQIIAVN